MSTTSGYRHAHGAVPPSWTARNFRLHLHYGHDDETSGLSYEQLVERHAKAHENPEGGAPPALGQQAERTPSGPGEAGPPLASPGSIDEDAAWENGFGGGRWDFAEATGRTANRFPPIGVGR